MWYLLYFFLENTSSPKTTKKKFRLFTTNHYYNRHRTIKSMLFSMQPHHHTCVMVYFFLSYRCCSLKIFTVNRLKGKLRRCLACLTAVRTHSKKFSIFQKEINCLLEIVQAKLYHVLFKNYKVE